MTTNVNYRDLTAEIVSETEGWLTYTIARPTEGGADTDVTAYFSMAKNDGETPREATVTIKGVKNGTAVKLKVTQLPKSKIEPEKLAYFLDVEAQTLDIPVTANVEFDVTVGEGADGWFTHIIMPTIAACTSQWRLWLTDLLAAARSCSPRRTLPTTPEAADGQHQYYAEVRGLIEVRGRHAAARCYFPYLKNGRALNSSEERHHGGAGQYSGDARIRIFVDHHGCRG